MYRKCVTEISAQHQKQIVSALLELMQQQAYEDITVTQLCETAGISRRIFYHLFNHMTDALHAMIDDVLLGLEGFRTDLRDDRLRFFLYWKEQKPLLDALSFNQMTDLLMVRMLECVISEDLDVRHWLKVHDRDTGTDIIVFYLCGIMGLTYNWYSSNYRKSPEEMARLAANLIQDPSEDAIS